MSQLRRPTNVCHVYSSPLNLPPRASIREGAECGQRRMTRATMSVQATSVLSTTCSTALTATSHSAVHFSVRAAHRVLACSISQGGLRLSSSLSCETSALRGLSKSVLREKSLGASQCTHRPAVTMATAVEPLEVLVKAATGEPEKLGDCPFSQRVLLTLEEKKVPYKSTLVDTANKPQWFLDQNPEGKVPVIKYEGKWIPDSDVIVDLLEKDYPETSLKPPEDAATFGSKLFPSFAKFLKSKDPSDGTETALLDELKALELNLSKYPGPYAAGEKVTSVDLSLAPKLYHLKVAAPYFKQWPIPEEFVNVREYIKALESLESFKKTTATEEVVINGWKRALGV
eukprot:TRINITY_DN32652_c0_g1_i1.p1 TRINITY_DN32652_c0_g1~~TRINITY_DN32652_c0_g1_i1.p1  ORF type:complete len:343 (-),score=47.87 TRINITY_DN32652_c0_g1_i1:700-1728(-)